MITSQTVVHRVQSRYRQKDNLKETTRPACLILVMI